MGQGITIDIQAKVVGYQESIKQLQAALAKVDPGSEIGKKLSNAIAAAQKQVTELSKNMFPKASSDSSVDAIVEKVNRAGAAIQEVAALFSSVNLGDLNLKALGPEINSIIGDLNKLEGSINSTLNGGIQEAVSNSELLSGVFKELGINIKDLTADGGKIALAQGLQDATVSAGEAAAALEEAKSKVTELQGAMASMKSSSPFLADGFDIKSLVDQFNAIKDPDKIIDMSKLDDLKSKMMEGLSRTNISDKGAAQTLIENMFGQIDTSTTLETFKGHLRELKRQLQEELGATGNDAKTTLTTSGDGTKLFNNLLGIDENSLEASKAQLRALVETFKQQLGTKNEGTIINLINNNKVEQAAQMARRIISDAFDKVINEYNKKKEELNQAVGNQTDAEKLNQAASEQVQRYTNANNAYSTQMGSLEKEVASLRVQVEDLQRRLAEKTSEALGNVRGDAGTAGGNAGKNVFPTGEADKYKSKLNEIHSAEQMVGKLQGVVQRWFSVYAAVRMVTNAIKDVINNAKELDKTITEIAIVTNMDQSQLWGQMDQYIDMARQYGASISGAYKVSQLYYQQGLGQEDVMKLSAETLKMARISGLDYAQATDYMTNAIRSFKLEMQDAQTVVDTYSAVAAKSATSVTELATAMSKTASSAQAVGASLQNTTAMMAVMIEATRESPENIGSALKSIISRYGELKENKTGIDEEGEEYSLNKVDKALQTVGISIHDAQGEFRDFDDVIMELSEHWNEIDKNTQRYIATVMAGNRQQSRFLALVSSGERLKELSETAANSEDASQSQFLKTMDSIEYKSQQLQTSLQSLWTESGVQNLIKGTLDGLNNIVQTFSNMPKTFDLPIAAIAKFGVMFANIAKIVTTTFAIIKKSVAAQIDTLRSEGLAKTQQTANQEVAITEEKNQRILQSEMMVDTYKYNRAQGLPPAQAKQETLALWGVGGQGAGSGAQTLTGKDKLKALFSKGGKGTMLAGYGLSILGSALSMSAMGMGEDTQADRDKKALTTLLGSTATGAGMGAMFGPIGIAIGGLVGGIVGAIESIDIRNESDEERAKRLAKQSETAKNENIEKKQEFKSLESTIKEYEKLRDAHLESAEAAEEYKEKCNQIAEDHPDLVSGYDTEGNAVLNLAAAYDRLAEAKKGENESSAAAADAAIAEARNKTDEAKKIASQVQAEENAKQLLASGDYNTTEDFLEELDRSLIDTNDYQYNETMKFSVNGQNMGDLIRQIRTLSGLGVEDYSDLLGSYQELLSDPHIREFASKYGGVENIYKLYDALYGNLQTSGTSGSKNVSEAEKTSAAARRREKEEQALIATSSQSLATGFIQQRLLEDQVTGVPENQYLQDFKNSKVLAGRFINARYNAAENKNNYFSEHAEQDFTDFSDAFALVWERLYQDEREELDSLITNSSNYTKSEMAKTLAVKFDLHEGNPVYDSVMAYYTDALTMPEDILEITTQTKGRRDKTGKIGDKIKDGLKTADDFLQDEEFVSYYGENAEVQATRQAAITARKSFLSSLGESEKQAVIKFYNGILDAIENKSISEDAGEQLTDTYVTVWKALTSNAAIFENNDTLRQEAQTLLAQSDFTTAEGIQNFLAGLQELGIKLSDLELENVNFNAIKFPVNFAASVQTFGDTMVSKMEDFGKDMNSATKGMKIGDAAKMADKLGISLTKFRQEGQKFFLDDYSLLEEYYFGERQEAIQKLEDDQKEELAGVESLTKNTEPFEGTDLLLSNLLDAEEWTDSWQKNVNELFGNEGFIAAAQKEGISPSVLQRHVEDFMKTDGPKGTEQFLKYLETNFKDLYDAYVSASGTAITDMVASSQLERGDIESFLKTTGAWKTTNDYSYIHGMPEEVRQKLADQANADLIDRISTGDISNLPKELEQYAKLIYDTYHSVYSSIGSSMNTAISGGANQMFVDDTNISALQDLYDQGFFNKKTDKNGKIIENYQLQKGDIVSLTDEVINGQKSLDTWINEHYTNATDKIKALSEYYSAISKNTIQTSTDLMEKTGIIEFEEMANYLQDVGAFDFGTQSTTGDEYAKVLKKYGLEFNEKTRRFIIKDTEQYLAQLKADVEALGDNATLEERNAAQARYDTELKRITTERTEALNTLFNNYDEISQTDLEQIANAFEEDYETLRDNITEDNGLGGRKINIKKAQSWLKTQELTDEQLALYEELIAGVADDYLKNIQTVVSLVTKGTTSQKDIEAFKTTYKSIMDKELDSDAFKFDKELNSWTLAPQILREFIEKQATDAGLTGQEWADYVSNQLNQNLALAVDFNSFITAENNDNNSLAYKQLKKSLTNYYEGLAKSTDPADYIDKARELVSTGNFSETAEEMAERLANEAEMYNENILGMSVDEAIETMRTGGDKAVNLATKIAGASGKELTTEEMQKYYAPLAEKYSNMAKQIAELTIGQYVGEGDLRNILQSAGVVDESGIVIASVSEMVSVYQEIYNKMSSGANATAAQLNSVYAKMLTSQEQGEIDAISMMNDAMGMTYEALGEMLGKYGIKLEDWLVENAANYEKIGAGQIRITDFNAIAQSMGWEYGSELYMQALKSYNDSVIAQSEQESQEMINEFTALAEARQGKQINLTNFIHAIAENEEAEAEDYEAYLETLQLGERIRQKKGLRRNKTTGEYEEAEDSDEARAALKKLRANARAAAKKRMSEQLEAELNVYNATLEDGILTLNEGANLIGIAQVLKSHASEAGIELEEDMAKLADTVSSIIKKYVDAINKGIEGTLTEVEKVELQGYASSLGLGELTFEKTVQGLKLSQESAIALYQELKKVDALQASLVFDKLNSSLKETNEHYSSISSILAHINDLSNKLSAADSKISDARRKEYEAELAVAKEILAIRSTSEDESFNFMSNKIPGGQNNPINYYNNWAQAIQKVREALKQESTTHVDGKTVKNQGLIDYQDWYNIVTEMGNIASLTAEGVTLGNITLHNAEEAAKLIEKSADALTVDSSGNVKVALSNITGLGLDLKTGAADMAANVDEGIRAMAKSQVEMLDGLIAMLELIVAMEDLGDITAEGQEIDLSNMIKIKSGEGDSIEVEFTAAYIEWRDRVNNLITEKLEDGSDNPDYSVSLNKLIGKISINGESLKDLLTYDEEQMAKQGEDFVKAYNATLFAMYNAAINNNYDTDDVARSLKEILVSAGVADQEITIDVGNSTIVLSGGKVDIIDWTQEQKKKTLARYLQENKGKTEEEAKKDLSNLLLQYNKGATLLKGDITYILQLKKHYRVKTDENGNETYEVFYNNGWHEYDPNSPEAETELGKARLDEMGATNLKEIDAGVVEGEVTVGSKTNVKVKSNKGEIQYYDDEGQLHTNWHTQEDYLKGMFALKNPGKTAEENQLDYEAWVFAEYKIRVRNKIKFSDDNGNELNIDSDPTLRADIQDFLAQSKSQIEQQLKDGVEGGGTLTIDWRGKKISFIMPEDGGLTADDAVQQLLTSLGMDDLSTMLAATFQGDAFGDAMQSAVSSGVISAFGEGGIPLESLKITAEKVTTDDEVHVEPIAEGEGTITHLKVTAQTVDAEGNITGVEITGQLDGKPISVVIDKDGAIKDIGEIQAALTALHGEVTVKVGESGVDAVQKAIDRIHGKTVLIHATYAGGNVKATGDVGLAKAQGTLMGELGPELVVSKGRYFVVGQDGPEMVDLADDAIVFNHLQTKSLLEKGMSNGRGRAVTNEQKAVSFATGNVHGGPAMASASAALAALKQLRAQWASLAKLSAKDLAGKGGGGGGGGDPKPFIKQLERWYNWLQEIARLEKEINYEEAKRSKYATDFNRRGGDYVRSQEQTLKHLQSQVAIQKNLNKEQEKYFKDRIAQVNANNGPFTSLYTIDDNGQLKYKPGQFEWLSNLQGTDETGKPRYTAEEQYNAIIAKNPEFAKYMEYDSSGNPIKKEGNDWYATALQAFWDKIDMDRDEFQGLFDSIEEGKAEVEKLEQERNEILKEMEDNQIAVEQKVLKAVEESRQREIDELQKQRDAIEKGNQALIEGLNNQLQKEQEMYSQQQETDELSKLQRQLAILQRSGGSAASIADLQDQIADKQQSMYFEAQQQQIDALQEASDNELERLDHQIDIMQETLDFEKENGLLWNQVYTVLDGSSEEIAQYIQENTSEYWGKSPTELAQTMRENLFTIDKFKELQVIGGMEAMIAMYNDQKDEEAAEDEKKNKEAEEAAAAAAGADSSVNTGSSDTGGTNERWKATYTGKEHSGYGIGSTAAQAKANATALAKKKNPSGSYQVNKPYKLATGGLVKQPTYALIGEEGEEGILNAAQTEYLRKNLMGRHPDSFVTAVDDFFATLEADKRAMMALTSANNANDYASVNIEHASVNLQIDKLANDYDARRAANTIMQEMLHIASKSQSNNSVGR